MPREEYEKQRLINEYSISFRSRNHVGKSLEGLMIDMATYSPRLFELTYRENASAFLVERELRNEQKRLWILQRNQN